MAANFHGIVYFSSQLEPDGEYYILLKHELPPEKKEINSSGTFSKKNTGKKENPGRSHF